MNGSVIDMVSNKIISCVLYIFYIACLFQEGIEFSRLKHDLETVVFKGFVINEILKI